MKDARGYLQWLLESGWREIQLAGLAEAGETHVPGSATPVYADHHSEDNIRMAIKAINIGSYLQSEPKRS
jgi:hypothetical protein